MPVKDNGKPKVYEYENMYTSSDFNKSCLSKAHFRATKTKNGLCGFFMHKKGLNVSKVF